MDTLAYVEEVAISLSLCIAALIFKYYVDHLDDKDDKHDQE